MIYGTFLGGLAEDVTTAIALDAAGNVYVAGTTQSSVFPVTTGALTGGDFVAVLNSDGSGLIYSSRYPSGSISTAISLDGAGTLHLVGPSGSVAMLKPGGLSVGSAPFLLAAANAASTAFSMITQEDPPKLDPEIFVAGTFTPGEVISLYGNDLGPSNGVFAQADNAGKLPTSLAGTEVLLDGVPIPLLYVPQGQVNAVTPFSLGAYPHLAVKTHTESSALSFVTMPSDPAIYLLDGHAAAINEDGTVNSPTHPAKAGSTVAIWATGLGSIKPTPPDGQIAISAQPHTCCWDPPGNAGVVYYGAAPGMVTAVAQVNVRIPAELIGLGVFTQSISVAGSPTAVFYVSQ